MPRKIRQTISKVRSVVTAKAGSFGTSANDLLELTALSQDAMSALRQQAAHVVATQKQTELRLTRAIESLEHTVTDTHHVVAGAAQAKRSKHTAEARELEHNAELYAAKMITLEKEVECLKDLHQQISAAADHAKAAVRTTASDLRTKLTQKFNKLSQVDKVLIKEKYEKAIEQLDDGLGQEWATLEQVKTKIDDRYSRAIEAAENASDVTTAAPAPPDKTANGTSAAHPSPRGDELSAEVAKRLAKIKTHIEATATPTTRAKKTRQ